jgi:tetratricopeptide (TPR) repeat protein
LRRGALAPRAALDIVIDLCNGLIHAQQMKPGIVHRDLKPENILIAQGEIAKITDFGLAKVVQETRLSVQEESSSKGGRQSLFGEDGIVGTPPYMAPEQWRGEELDERTDLYAVGCILYELMAGELAFQAKTKKEWLRLHLEGAVPKTPREHPLCEPVNGVLTRLLAKERSERYLTAGALKEALADIYKKAFCANPRVLPPGEALTSDDYISRGATYQMLGKYEAALADYDRAISLDPSDARAYNNRGNTYDALGKVEAALADFDRAVALDPANAEAYNNRGLTFHALGKYGAALVDYDRAIAINPQFSETWYNKGNVLNGQGRYEEALVDYDRAIAINSHFAEAWFNKGNALRGLGDYETALSCYYQAVSINPQFASAYLSIGVFWANKGELQRALSYFEKAAQLGDPQGAQYVVKAKQMLGQAP